MRFLALRESSPRGPRPVATEFFAPGCCPTATCRNQDLLRLLRRRLRRGLCDRSALLRGQQRHQDVAFHARHGLDLAVLADFAEQARHFRAAHFLVGHFAAAMKNHGAHFVAFAEEADDLVLANLIVVLRGGRPELYFLELRAAAALALLVGFLVLLVKKLALIGDLANRRICRRRYFHQVESSFARHLDCFVRLHDAKLAAFFIDHPDFARPDPLIDARAVALPEVTFCDNSP